MHRIVFLLAALIAASGALQARPVWGAEGGGTGTTVAPRDCWLKTPTVSIMTGFIYDPRGLPYTIQQWMVNLGDKFDSEQWVKDFKDAGATHMVFYDKWVDGLVFHDTKTTHFKTKRDFVRELAAACQRHHLKLVFYFNAVSDGNPEFDEWATLDKAGRPIVCGIFRTRFQTLHSPFHQKCVEQMRELLSNYGPIHGIWHDIFTERPFTTSAWVAKGYEKMYGEPYDRATPMRLAEFNARTLAGYLDEVEAIRIAQGQNSLMLTSNHSAENILCAGVWADKVGSRLQYLYQEGHSFGNIDYIARLAWVLPKPVDICLLVNSSWFVPLDDAPPPTHMTDKQVLACAAIAVCQGAGINFAITPGHSGTFGDDLKQVKRAGDWFRQTKPYLENARPYADVAIVAGSPAVGGPELPIFNELWKNYQGRAQGSGIAMNHSRDGYMMNPQDLPRAWNSASVMRNALTGQGVFSQIFYMDGQATKPLAPLDGYRAVFVPEMAVLDESQLERLRQYVRQGGRLIAFGHASLLDEKAQWRKDYGLADVLGVRLEGEMAVPPQRQRATVEVDSEYGAEFSRENLLTGQGECWSSGDTPMPHWVAFTLAKPVDVAGIELVGRTGPYQIADFAIEVPDGEGWKTIKTVQKARGGVIGVAFNPPVRTSHVRIKILRGTAKGFGRHVADLKAVRIMDRAGFDWVAGHATRLPLRAEGPETTELFDKATSRPMVVRVKPTTATLMASLKDETMTAAIWKNTFGRGEAWLVTTSDDAIEGNDPLWTDLAQLAVGEPTLIISPADAQRYRIIVTNVAEGHALHVIDAAVDRPRASPRPVTISLLRSRLDCPSEATLINDKTPLSLSSEKGRMQLVVQPDPVASVLLK